MMEAWVIYDQDQDRWFNPLKGVMVDTFDEVMSYFHERISAEYVCEAIYGRKVPDPIVLTIDQALDIEAMRTL